LNSNLFQSRSFQLAQAFAKTLAQEKNEKKGLRKRNIRSEKEI